MKPPSEKQALPRIVESLADLLGSAPERVRSQAAAREVGYDYAISLPGHRFLVEYKSSAAAGPLAGAIQNLTRVRPAKREQRVPLVVVPFMGSVGQELCHRSEVSWLDLSGNASISAPGLKIHIEGRPNRFRERGRPPNIFASKSSRVSRQLLLHPRIYQSQAEIARQTGLGDGYVSKIVRRLRAEELLDSSDEGAVRPRDPDLLLDDWRDAYDFRRHRVLKGHVPARSGEELVDRAVAAFNAKKSPYAATGLSAAWLYTTFANFRLVTFYLATMPTRSLLESLEFVEEPKGANLWLALPDDDGVFHESRKVSDIQCASPIQVYLDLKHQPERANEAAAELRRKLLNWDEYGR